MSDTQALSIVRERLFDDSMSVRVTVVRSPLSPSLAGHSIFVPAAKRPNPSSGQHHDAYGAPFKPPGPRQSELDDGIGSRGTSQADEASLPPNSPERYGDGRSVADDSSPARISMMGAHPLKHSEGGQTNPPFKARAASAVAIMNDDVGVASPHMTPSLGGAGMKASEVRRSGVEAAAASEHNTSRAHQYNSAGQPTSLAALPMYGGDGVNPSPTFNPISPPCMLCIGVRRLYGLDWCARHATDPQFQDMYGAYASTGWVPPELPLALTAGPTSGTNAAPFFQPPAASAADAAALALAPPSAGSDVPMWDARAMADAVYRPDPNASLASVVAAAPSYARQQRPSLLDSDAPRPRTPSVADNPSYATQVRPAPPAPVPRRVSSTPAEAANGNGADTAARSRTGTTAEEEETEVALPALRTWPSPDRVKRAGGDEEDGPPPPPPPPSRTPLRIFKGAVTHPPPSPTKSASNISVNSDRAWERPPVQDGFASDLLSFLSEIQQSDKGLDGQQPDLSKGEPKVGDDEEGDAAWVAEPSFSF